MKSSYCNFFFFFSKVWSLCFFHLFLSSSLQYINMCVFVLSGSPCQPYWLPADWYFWGWICTDYFLLLSPIWTQFPYSVKALLLMLIFVVCFRWVCWPRVVIPKMTWGFQPMMLCWSRSVSMKNFPLSWYICLLLWKIESFMLFFL